jgi:hypothetical protein
MDTEQDEGLVSEIVENARSDRARLTKVADKLGELMSSPLVSDGEAEPEVALTISEEMSRVTDSLTRVNQQLVELVKARLKPRAGEGNGKVLNEKERDQLYRKMEGTWVPPESDA